MPTNEPQASAQPQIEVDLDSYIATLTGQRNQAMDTVAQQAGVIAKLQKDIAALKDKLPPEAPGARPGPTLVPPAAE